jgi:molybdopterin-containing oxidoreductase family membrane subunit
LTSYALLVAITVAVYVHALLGRAELGTNRAAELPLSALYLVNIIFFAGASGGAILLGALVRALRIGRAKSIVRVARRAATTALALVTMFMALDVLGRGRLLPLARAAIPSVVIAEIPFTAIYLVHAIAIAFFASQFNVAVAMRRMSMTRIADPVFAVVRSVAPGFGTRRSQTRMLRLAKWLLPAALLLRSTPLWMEGLAEMEPGSRALLILGPCYVSCIVSGLALVTVVATMQTRVRKGEDIDAATRGLAVAMRLLIPILGYGVFAEMWMTMEARDPIRHHLFAELVVGSYAPFFWFALVGGVIVPFVLLVSTPHPPIARIRLAALLTVLGVLVVRWSTVVAALLGHAHRLYAAGGYAPSAAEAALTVAVYATGLLIGLRSSRRSNRNRRRSDRAPCSALPLM